MTNSERREEDLVNYTRKANPDVTVRAVFTLSDDRKCAMAIGRLMVHLHDRKLLSDDDIDNLLLEAAGKQLYMNED
jgi:hypothetical protein